MRVTAAAHSSHVARNLGVVVLIILLAGGGGVGYSYAKLSGQIADFSLGGLVLAQPSASVLLQLGVGVLSSDWLGVAMTLVTGITLDAQLSITNGGVVAATISSATHELDENRVVLGSDSTDVGMTVNPGQTVTIPVQQTIETSSLSQLASSIVSSGGDLNVQIKDQAHISVVGLPLSATFQQSSQVSLIQELEQHIEELITGQSGSTQPTNQYISNPPSSGGQIVNGEYNVSPGKYYPIPFTLSSSATVTGSFSATASLGNNIIVYIFDQSNYALYQNGQSSSVYYNSGKVASGNINVYLNSGTYYIVLDNTYSTFSTKDVTIQMSSS